MLVLFVSEPSGIVSFEEVVVPAGNTYANPKFYSPVEYLPFDELPVAVAEQFKKIAPEYTDLQIQKHGSKKNVSWSIETKMEEKDEYTFSFLPDGKIIRIRSAGGAQAMLRPYIPRRIEAIEEIQGNLSKYGDRFHGGGAELYERYGKMGSVNHYVVVDILPESIEMRVVHLIAKEQ